MQAPEFVKKMNDGPVLILTVLPNGPMGIGQSLVLWFIYSLIVGVFAGYVAGRALPAGAEYLQVFRLAGVTALSGYALALLQMSIWYRRQWSSTIKACLDGLIYALLTAGTFGWLWPQAAAS
jgi:FtsH-binding integral membrane protein